MMARQSQAALAAALLLSAGARADKYKPPPAEAHLVLPTAPSRNLEHEHQRMLDSERSAQEVMDQDQQQVRGAPPPNLDAPQEAPSDWSDLVIYYGILGLLVLVAVTILYRYLTFRFSLDMAPEGPELEAEVPSGPRPVARPPSMPPTPAARVGSDPRLRAPAAPPPAEPVSSPRLRPPAPAPAPAASSAPKPRPAAPSRPPAAAPSLLDQAVKLLSGSDRWVTAGGLAQALGADEGAVAKILDNLADSGQVQEAKAQDGQTVYRYTR